MAIVPLEPVLLTERQELFYDILMALDEAATGDKPVSVHELAETIMRLIDDSKAE